MVAALQMLEPDVSAMAFSGLSSAVLGRWEITLDEGTYIWGTVVVKNLKDAVILTDAVIPCKFSFRQQDQPDLLATPGVPSVVALHWGDEYAILEKCEKDFLIWRSPPLPDGTLGEHNVWKRMDELNSVGVDELTQVRATAAEELAKLRASVSSHLSQAAQEVDDVHCKLDLANELAEARARVADEIAEDNFALRKLLDAQAVRCESLYTELQALREASECESTPKAKDQDVNLSLECTPPKSLESTPEGKVRAKSKHGAARCATRTGKVSSPKLKKIPQTKKRRSEDAPTLALAACGA